MIIKYDNEDIKMHEELSSKDFTEKAFVDIPDGTNVYMSCFSCETPDSPIFRADMTGVTFYNCNLDNCLIPDGNTVVGGSIERFMVQNDMRDWKVDEEGAPVKVVNEEFYIAQCVSVDKKDIPSKKVASEEAFIASSKSDVIESVIE